MSKISQYVTVRISQDEHEAPIDVGRFVHDALSVASWFRDDVSLVVREVDEVTYLRSGRAQRDDVSVEEFVEMVDEGDGLAHVLVFEQEGDSRQILRETRTTCSITAQILRDALRTWDGWK